MRDAGTPSNDERGRQAFLFVVDKQAFGVDPNHVLEVVSAEEPTRVPFTPKWVEGVISARGSVIPVIDISAYFGLKQKGTGLRNRLVILGLDEISFAFACDHIIGVESLDESALEEPLSHLPQILRECSKAQIKFNEHVVMLLDSQTLLEQSRDRVRAS